MQERHIDLATRLLVGLTYLWRHGRVPRLSSPRRFTEFVQHRKLYDHDPRYPTLIDKLTVKETVTAILGPEWVTPTLWSGSTLPPRSPWPAPFVVKSRHGCNQRVFVRTGEQDWAAIRKLANRWMRSTYGGWLFEWGYRDVPRGLLVEPFLGHAGQLPIDYKIYVFHGRAEFVQVHLEREHDHRWIVFDRDWRLVSRQTKDAVTPPPASLDRMLAGAEALGRAFDHARIDFYEIDGAPRFGEMTFYPGSGLDRFDPQSLDAIFGARWAAGNRTPIGHRSSRPNAASQAMDRH